MISWFAYQLRYLYGVVNTHESPRQLAFGCAFGVLIGLLPKGNLLAVVVAILFFASRVNLSVGMLTALAISFCAGYFDPFAHRLGHFLLSAPPLQSLWTSLYNTPMVPWTRFNNTVVLGNLVIGLFLYYPVYVVTLPLFERWKQLQARRAQRNISSAVGDAAPMLLAWRRQQSARLLAEIESISDRRRAA